MPSHSVHNALNTTIEPLGKAYGDESIGVGSHLTDSTNFDTIVKRIDYGGFSVLAFGNNRLTPQQPMIAYKTPRRSLLADRRVRANFIRECLLWCSLWPHPNIVQAYAVLEMRDAKGPRPFIALEYAEQGSLRGLLMAARRTQVGGRLPLEIGLHLAQQIAAGLAYLHQPNPAFFRTEPILHRDLKPENVLIKDGRAMVTDFGLVKAVQASPAALAALLVEAGDEQEPSDNIEPSINGKPTNTVTGPLHTAAGIAIGTPAYMPAEQWQDARNVSPAADIYAFGVMLSELLAGRHALLDLDRPHSQAGWRQAHLDPHPRPLREVDPHIPPRIEALYLRCLAGDPRARPSAVEVLAELQVGALQSGVDVYNPKDTHPDTPENEAAYWHNAAIAYLTFNYYEEALQRVNHALAIQIDAWQVLITKGNILASMEQREDALAAYHAALSALPSDEVMGRKAAWMNIGNLLSFSGQYAKADTAFQDAIDAIDAMDVMLQSDVYFYRALNLRYWGMAVFEDGGVEEAALHIANGIQFAELAANLDPDNLRYQQLLAALRHFSAATLQQTS